MVERDRVDASTNFCSRSVAVTGRRYLRHRPVDANQLFYFLLLNLWLSLVGGNSAIARLTVLFYFILLNLWLSLVGVISAIARLKLTID